MSAEPEDKYFFHYTSNAALLSIISSGELWFSDVRFLNDAREFRHSCDILRRKLDKVAEEHREKWIEAGCRPDNFVNMVKNMRHKLGDYLSSYNRYFSSSINKEFPPFIFSLTQNPDSLSQWRAYGNAEYCLRINVSRLIKSIDEISKASERACVRARLIKIEYIQQDQDIGATPESLTRFFTDHIRHINTGGGIDPEVFFDGADDVTLPSDFFMKYKDYGFHEEKEWRLVVNIAVDDERIFFDQSSRYPKPRAKVKIFVNPREAFDIIDGVVCGPGADKERAKASLFMLSRHMGGPILTPSFSTIPFRTD